MPTDVLEKDNVSMTIKGLDMKDPVYVEPITGKVHEVKTVILRGGLSGGNVRRPADVGQPCFPDGA